MISVNTYANKEVLLHGGRKYRTVFLRNKTSFVFCEFTFFNLFFEKSDWTGVFKKGYRDALILFDAEDERSGGGLSLYVIKIKVNIGNLYSAKNEIQKAEQQFEEIIKDFSPKVNSIEIQTVIAEVFNMLAYLNKRKLDFGKTEFYFKQALAVYEKLIPSNSVKYTILASASKAKLSDFSSIQRKVKSLHSLMPTKHIMGL